MKWVAKDGIYELLSWPTHLSNNKITRATILSSSSMSESINCNQVFIVSFRSNIKELIGINIIESSKAGESSNSDLRALKDIDLWYFRLGQPNIFALKNVLLSYN